MPQPMTRMRTMLLSAGLPVGQLPGWWWFDGLAQGRDWPLRMARRERPVPAIGDQVERLDDLADQHLASRRSDDALGFGGQVPNLDRDQSDRHHRSSRWVRFSPRRRISPSWSTRRQLGLGVRRQLGHLVEEDGAARNSSSSPFRSCAAPVNAPLACPNSSDSHSSWPSTAQLTGTKAAARRETLLVIRPADQLLAGARLALDEHWERRAGDPRDLLLEIAHRRAVADEPRHAARFAAAAARPVGVALHHPGSA